MELTDEESELAILSSLDRFNGSNKVNGINDGNVSSSPSYFSYSNDYRNHEYHGHESEHDADSFPAGLRTPSLLSSPSVVSSLGYSGHMSPLRRELSRPSLHDEELDASPTARRSTGRRPVEHNRDALARRLSHLAEQLTASHDDFEDNGMDALTAQLDLMERAVNRRRSQHHNSSYGESPYANSPLLRKSYSHAAPSPSPVSRATPQRSVSVDLRSFTNTPARSLFSSPGSSVFRTRYSDLSASIFRDLEPKPDLDPPPKTGMTIQQAKKVIAESIKLNGELSILVTNLKARQEESDHIHALLVERAERAAQRIIFLQTRIAHL